MKRSIKVSICVVFVAGTFGWWLSRRVPQAIPALAPDAAAPTAVEQTSELTTHSEEQPGIVQPFAKTPFLGLADPRWTERRRLQNEDPSYQWRTPIEFFGKVVDENSQPVGGAIIEYSWSGTSAKYGGDGVGHKTITSDSNGLFHIHGIEGKGMTVLVSKKGYYRRSKPNGWFEYAGFWEPKFIEPDRSKPVVFHLVKRPVAEPTYHVGGRIFLEPPTLETHLDLVGQNIQSQSPADLYVRITRPSEASYEKPFDWSVTVEGRDGAEIVDTTDEFMLRAPEDGYQSMINRDFKNPTGNARQKLRFYVDMAPVLARGNVGP